jgi:WD40 repeat protein
LIDARLLTSYEVREDEHEPTRRIEIIHESLLANWPRLVRWQTQDQEGAQLRDELRQAARAWDEHGRHNDRLWSGTAFQEYQLWRERYPGGLTDVEEAFGVAMVALAGRRRRRRRMAVASVIATLVIGLAVVGSFWRRSVSETRRAEAQKLIALGQIQFEDYPTAALANAIASLELTDSEQARLLALESLWQGPTAFVVSDRPSINSDFSADSEWLVQTHEASSSLTIIRSDGVQRVVDAPSDSGSTRTLTSFRNSRDFFISFGEATDTGQFGFWSAEEGRLLAATRLQDLFVHGPDQVAILADEGEPRALFATSDADFEVVRVDILDADGRHERIGDIRLQTSVFEGSRLCMAPDSPLLAVIDGRQVSILEVSQDGLSNRRHLGRQFEGRPFHACRFDPNGRFFLTVLNSGTIQAWDPTGAEPPKTLVAPPRTMVKFAPGGSLLTGVVFPEGAREDGEILIWAVDRPGFPLLRRIHSGRMIGLVSIDLAGRWLATRGPLPNNRLWSLGAPAAAEPTLLRRGPAGYVQEVDLSPDGRWVASNHGMGLTMWPLARPQPAVIPVDLNYWIGGLAFDSKGNFLAYAADDVVTVVPLQPPIPPPGKTAFTTGTELLHCLAVSPDGKHFATGDDEGTLWIGSEGSTEPTSLSRVDLVTPNLGTVGATFGPDGRYVAFLTGVYDLASAVHRVWDLESNVEVAELHLPGEETRFGSSFATDGRLLTATTKGVVAWDVKTGDHQRLLEQSVMAFVANSNGRRILYIEEGEGGLQQDPAGSPVFVDLETGTSTTLASHGLRVRHMALDGDGEMVVTGDRDGVVRVGRTTGEEPHLLLGHEGKIRSVAIDPAGRWIASAGDDKTVRLWPVPDLSKPPLHTLPREELIAKLKTLTNLRVVRDPESSTGWKLTHDPFPGWETVPEW